MHTTTGLLLALVAASLTSGSAVKRTDDTYTECYADRGLVQSDASEAAKYLSEVVTFAGGLQMAKDDCVYKRHNTSIASLCNGNARDRTVTQAEVSRGMNQLFQDCNQLGAFTGVHVVNNLTFAAYGIFGGVNIRVPEDAPPPDTPGGRRSTSWLEFVGHSPMKKRQDPGEPNPNDPDEVGDCVLAFNGDERTDCAMGEDVEWANDDKTECGPIDADTNECQAFCEKTRRGLLGPERRAPGEFGETHQPGIKLSMSEGEETSISQGFSITLEGVIKEVFGGGVGYDWSVGSATARTATYEVEPSDEYQSRWVYFPKLVESCGVISKKTYSASQTQPYIPASCQGDVESADDQCTISAHKDSEGEAVVFWAVRFEKDGKPVDIDDQHPSYANLCNDPDPDGDGKDECLDEPLDPEE